MTDSTGVDARDHARLTARGLTRDEVDRQIELLREPPPKIRLDRPCTVGDGIVRLDRRRHRSLLERHAEASRRGRLTKMVPASGAASRMFQALQAVRGGADDPEAEAAVRALARGLDRLPFGDAVPAEARRDLGRLATAIVGQDGLDLAARPKGLIPFHRAGDGARTAFEEHLAEGIDYLRDDDGRCRYHFTVSPDHEAAFRTVLEGSAANLATRLGVRFDVGFSHQSPATDTVAIDAKGNIVRDEDGTVVLRPGGHGALLCNLQDVADHGADIVFLKNIDNVVPEGRQPPVTLWQRLLSGLLLELQDRVFDVLRDLESGRADGHWLDDALKDLARTFGHEQALPHLASPSAAKRVFLADQLHRPLRVCAMVINSGEPGGGPFWARGPRGVTPQIVEGAQVDRRDSAQGAILGAATHFSPAALVCGLRDHHGQPFRLSRFTDPAAVFVADKSHRGRALRALEHPGLWNGAMATWNTVFVEVPAETFAPVKTVLDLLRPEHQGQS